MANLYGSNATNVLNSTPAVPIDQPDTRSRHRVEYDTFTFAADITTSDTIFMGGSIPAGARVHEVVVSSTDLGTTGTISVGWDASADGVEVADPNGFIPATAVTAAAAIIKMTDTHGNAGFTKKFDAEVQPTITPTVNSDAGSGTIIMQVFYTLD
jgi:hypothetical protein